MFSKRREFGECRSSFISNLKRQGTGVGRASMVHRDTRHLLQPPRADSARCAGQTVRCTAIAILIANGHAAFQDTGEAAQIRLESTHNPNEVVAR